MFGVAEWAFIAAAPLCVLAEYALPRVAGSRFFSVENGRRAIYLLLQAAVGAGVTAALLGLMHALPNTHGLSAMGIPIVAQCLIVLLVLDFKIYLIHRAQHSFGWLWRFHRIHHSITEMNWLATGSTHLLELFVVQSMSSVVVVWAIGADPAAYLIGANVPSFVIGGIGAHLNIDFPRGRMPWWGRILTTPNAHGLHHARRVNSSNFGNTFMLWDTLFGTFEEPTDVPKEFGLPDEPAFPRGIIAQQLSPLRASFRAQSEKPAAPRAA